MNLADIQAMNPTEARKLTVEQLVQAIYEGQTYPIVNLVKDKYGNNIEQTDEAYRKYDNVLVGTKIVKWTYHDPIREGRVQDVDVREFYEDASPKSVLVSRHTVDPMEQPVVIARQVFAKPIAEPIEEPIGK